MLLLVGRSGGECAARLGAAHLCCHWLAAGWWRWYSAAAAAGWRWTSALLARAARAPTSKQASLLQGKPIALTGGQYLLHKTTASFKTASAGSRVRRRKLPLSAPACLELRHPPSDYPGRLPPVRTRRPQSLRRPSSYARTRFLTSSSDVRAGEGCRRAAHAGPTHRGCASACADANTPVHSVGGARVTDGQRASEERRGHPQKRDGQGPDKDAQATLTQHRWRAVQTVSSKP